MSERVTAMSALEEYVATHGVNELFSDALTAVLQKQPRDPAAFLASHFLAATERGVCADDNESMTMSNKELQAKPVASNMASGPLADGSIASEPPPSEAAGYMAYVERWQTTTSVAVKKEISLHAAMAATGQFATLLLEGEDLQRQLEELRHALADIDQGTDPLQHSKLALTIEDLESRHTKNSERLKAADDQLQHTMTSSAKLISQQVVDDRVRYDAALRSMDRQESGVLQQLTKLAAARVNTNDLSPLKVMDEAYVVVPQSFVPMPGLGIVPGEMQKARVESCDTGFYTVSLWVERAQRGDALEKGYDTAEKQQISVTRAELYASRKPEQSLSAAMQAAWCKRQELVKQGFEAREVAAVRSGGSGTYKRSASVAAALAAEPNAADTTSVEFLMLLYADAETTLPHLRALAQEVTSEVALREARQHDAKEAAEGADSTVHSIIAPLKGSVRATVKTLEKYRGKFSYLTDLARMTFKCRTLQQALLVVDVLCNCRGWKILLIKNRLMLEFDASETGGCDSLCSAHHTTPLPLPHLHEQCP